MGGPDRMSITAKFQKSISIKGNGMHLKALAKCTAHVTDYFGSVSVSRYQNVIRKTPKLSWLSTA